METNKDVKSSASGITGPKGSEDKLKAEAEARNTEARKLADERLKQQEKHDEDIVKSQRESVVPTTETVARIDHAANKALAVAAEKAKEAKAAAKDEDEDPNPIPLEFVIDQHGRKNHPGDIKFEVSAGGEKHNMTKGSVIVVSQEVAKALEAQGVGKILK